MYACHGTCVEVRVQLVGVLSCLPPGFVAESLLYYFPVSQAGCPVSFWSFSGLCLPPQCRHTEVTDTTAPHLLHRSRSELCSSGCQDKLLPTKPPQCPLVDFLMIQLKKKMMFTQRDHYIRTRTSAGNRTACLACAKAWV